MRAHLLTSTALIVILTSGYTSVHAADLVYAEISDPDLAIIEKDNPAVSALNAKIAAGFGVLEDESLGIINGSITAPVGHRFGLQLDGMVALLDGDDTSGGVGGHAFWRDPSFGLVGLYGSFTHVEWGVDEDVGQLAVEAEYYLDQITLSGIAGVEFGDSDGFLGAGTLSFYPVDNARFYAGYRYQLGKSFGVAGVEVLPEFTGMSNLAFFADGIIDEDGDYAAFGGVRLYLGGSDKSLKARHREDDPIETLLPPNLLQTVEPSKISIEPEEG